MRTPLAAVFGLSLKRRGPFALRIFLLMSLMQKLGMIYLVRQCLRAQAHPSRLGCDFACLGGYTPGSSFGHMGIANLGLETDKCSLSVGDANIYQPEGRYSLNLYPPWEIFLFLFI